mgnify:FL=1
MDSLAAEFRTQSPELEAQARKFMFAQKIIARSYNLKTMRRFLRLLIARRRRFLLTRASSAR